MISNAQVALEAASRVHQKVAAGISAMTTYNYTTVEGRMKVDRSTDDMVLATATKFLEWLNANA